MKEVIRDSITAILIGAVMPWLLISYMVLCIGGKTGNIAESPETLPEQTAADAQPLSVRVRKENGVSEEQMEGYLVGVVLAEMPANFETEALKAQAVVARTYTLRGQLTGGKHGDGSICTDPGCCQAYIAPEDYLLLGGTEEAVDKVRSAVADTSGKVLLYEGNVIEATYFSCSGGRTEDAEAVWGTDYPYLRSVSSPGEENAAHYSDTVTFSATELQNLLGITLDGEMKEWFGTVEYTDGNGVAVMEIGGKKYSGTQLRQLLGLRSTAFSVSVAGERVTFTTRGYGHRVGMSQYGAEAMAVSGKTYPEILKYYYQGTELVDWKTGASE